jgi:hypothetical protein
LPAVERILILRASRYCNYGIHLNPQKDIVSWPGKGLLDADGTIRQHWRVLKDIDNAVRRPTDPVWAQGSEEIVPAVGMPFDTIVVEIPFPVTGGG